MTDFPRKFSNSFFGAAVRVATLALFLAVCGVGAAHAQTLAYVTNSNGNSVTVIDTSTNTVTATIPVGSGPFGVAVTPDGAFAYVVNNSDATVSVISTATNTVTATIPLGEVGSAPVHVAFAVRTQGPTGIDQCKAGGWQTFTNPKFKNQGDCVSFVNHMNHGNH